MSFRFVAAPSRRRLFKWGGGLILGSRIRVFSPPATAQGLTVAPERKGWRFCKKCQSMFNFASYAGTDKDKGACAGGGKHELAGYDFYIPADVPGTPTRQNNWRECQYCRIMFYNGYREKGRCPATKRGHQPDMTFNFGLPHDIPGTPKAQNQWRFCNRCFALFYNGYAGKGACPAGGGHLAQGYDFVVPHDLHSR